MLFTKYQTFRRRCGSGSLFTRCSVVEPNPSATIYQGHTEGEFKMKKLFSIALISLSALALVACNTTAGAGRDLKSAGKTIEKTAEKAKD
jgi:predicted small secreted protein